MPQFLLRLLTLALVLMFCAVYAKNISLKDILALPATPPGVVIEIVTPEDEGLRWSLPQAQSVVM
jgi:hypothetical protein